MKNKKNRKNCPKFESCKKKEFHVTNVSNEYNSQKIQTL